MDDSLFQVSLDLSELPPETERTGLYYQVQEGHFTSLQRVSAEQRYRPPHDDLYLVVEVTGQGEFEQGLTKLFGLAQKREDSGVGALEAAGYTIRSYYWGSATSDSVDFPLGAHALPTSLRSFREEYLQTKE